MNVNDQGRNKYALQIIRQNLSLEQFAYIVNSIEKDSRKFIERLISEFALIDRPDLISSSEDDISILKVQDFIDMVYTKGKNPVEELLEVYKVMSKNFIPVGGFITGSFQSISFEQIPEHPIAKISFSEKKNVTIKARNNVIELCL